MLMVIHRIVCYESGKTLALIRFAMLDFQKESFQFFRSNNVDDTKKAH